MNGNFFISQDNNSDNFQNESDPSITLSQETKYIKYKKNLDLNSILISKIASPRENSSRLTIGFDQESIKVSEIGSKFVQNVIKKYIMPTGKKTFLKRRIKKLKRSSSFLKKRKKRVFSKNPKEVCFQRLNNFIQKFLLCKILSKEETLQNEIEIKIFNMFLKKKKYFLLGDSLDFQDIFEINRLSYLTTEKRTEERLKKVFKLGVKFLRKEFKRIPKFKAEILERLTSLKYDEEDSFFFYYFYDYCQIKKINFLKLFSGDKSKRQSNESVQKQYSKASINKNFLEKIKDCEKFFGKLKDYLLFFLFFFILFYLFFFFIYPSLHKYSFFYHLL